MLTGTHAEQRPSWYPQLTSFMQALTCHVVSEEKRCPAVNVFGLACNKFEFRRNMILISCVTLDKSHNAMVHRIAVWVQGSSSTSFCGNCTLCGASHWSLPLFPVCKTGMIISPFPFFVLGEVLEGPVLSICICLVHKLCIIVLSSSTCL